MNSFDADVIIVGCGPTGATLSLLLATAGVSSVIFERQPVQYPYPRAVHFDDQTMRVFQTAGIAEQLASVVRVNPGMRFVDAENNLLLDWPRPQEKSDNGWHTSYRFHQPDLEAILRQAIEDNPLVTLLGGLEVEDVTDHGDSVSVCVASAKGQTNPVNKRQYNAQYVIGCDGAGSRVRACMGSTMKSLGFKERWLVVDLLLKTDVPALGDATIQYCNPTRPATYVRCPSHRRRWEIMLFDHENEADMTNPAKIWSLLKQWITPEQADIERSAPYQFESAIASQWRKGRVLLAGDSAHLTPPFMGQGMCTGIRDTSNLAWKLACCANGHTDNLLDSYQTERQTHAKHYIETAMHLGRLINTAGTVEALSDAFRQPDGSVKMQSMNPALGPGLTAGDSLHSGKWFPQPTLANGQLLDQVTGYRPTLLLDSQLTESFLKNSKNKIEPLFTQGTTMFDSRAEPAVAELLERFDAKAILVRPDRYIYGTANNAGQLASLIANASSISQSSTGNLETGH